MIRKARGGPRQAINVGAGCLNDTLEFKVFWRPGKPSY